MERDENRFTILINIFISIHALRMERDGQLQLMASLSDDISIHALRMERDFREQTLKQYQLISIHALRMERDAILQANLNRLPVFQSTRSAWSATFS